MCISDTPEEQVQQHVDKATKPSLSGVILAGDSSSRQVDARQREEGMSHGDLLAAVLRVRSGGLSGEAGAACCAC